MTGLVCFLSIGFQADLSKYVYPLAKTQVCPKVEVNAADFPEGKAWGEAASLLVQGWYGKLTELLATDGKDPITGKDTGHAFKTPTVITLEVRKKINVPAYTSGATITINGEWITKRPDDLGMIIHELVHVIQHYGGRRTPGWLVEGIADYIRWWRYEPELHATRGRTKIDFTKANFDNSYRTTGMWLAWASRKYDMRLVPALDKACRDGRDPMEVFKSVTGKTAKESWKEFSEEK